MGAAAERRARGRRRARACTSPTSSHLDAEHAGVASRPRRRIADHHRPAARSTSSPAGRGRAAGARRPFTAETIGGTCSISPVSAGASRTCSSVTPTCPSVPVTSPEASRVSVAVPEHDLAGVGLLQAGEEAQQAGDAAEPDQQDPGGVGVERAGVAHPALAEDRAGTGPPRRGRSTPPPCPPPRGPRWRRCGAGSPGPPRAPALRRRPRLGAAQCGDLLHALRRPRPPGPVRSEPRRAFHADLAPDGPLELARRSARASPASPASVPR